MVSTRDWKKYEDNKTVSETKKLGGVMLDRECAWCAMFWLPQTSSPHRPPWSSKANIEHMESQCGNSTTDENDHLKLGTDFR